MNVILTYDIFIPLQLCRWLEYCFSIRYNICKLLQAISELSSWQLPFGALLAGDDFFACQMNMSVILALPHGQTCKCKNIGHCQLSLYAKAREREVVISQAVWPKTPMVQAPNIDISSEQ